MSGHCVYEPACALCGFSVMCTARAITDDQGLALTFHFKVSIASASLDTQASLLCCVCSHHFQGYFSESNALTLLTHTA